jgi:DNA-binding Lrp family transcriptional regulator
MTQTTIDTLDEQLLHAVQEEVPLVPRPYAALAERLDTTEQDVLDRLSAMRWGSRAVIRQVGAIFDSKSLGYQSTLVAARVAPERLDAAAAEINRHPGVSHNYRRDHVYNLWYTLAVPPGDVLGIERTAEILHQRSGAIATRLMPTLKMFKIGVKLDLAGDAKPKNAAASNGAARKHKPAAASLTERDKHLIRVLQQDLPITARPFDDFAEQAGVSVDDLLRAAEQYIADGRMRRFSAVLRHRELGFDANAMGVWKVPVDQQEQFGTIAAGFSAVSHCYLRPTYEDWPYSIFTMVHARTRAEGDATLAAIAEATGVRDRSALYSTHEYKKVRVKYFTGDVEEWERSVAALVPS